MEANAQLCFSMVCSEPNPHPQIHSWCHAFQVWPVSAAIVDDNGVFYSNYVCLEPVKHVKVVPRGSSHADVPGGESPREERGGELLERVAGEGRDGAGHWVVRAAERRGLAKREHHADDLEGRIGVCSRGYSRKCAEHEGTHRVPGTGDHGGERDDLLDPADQRRVWNRAVA